MILPITAEMLALVYDYLCCCPPFDKFSMPPSDEVKFKVSKSRKVFALYRRVGNTRHISVSERMVGSHQVLLSTMAHEMLHLHLDEVDACDMHGPVFQSLAERVCEIHGFDRLTF